MSKSHRIISREERHRAIKEAESIIRLGKKWQRLVPNERRPNFEAAAAALLRRVLGEHVEAGKRKPLNIHGGMQHQHDEREARLLERTLKVGTLPQEVLHSFQTGVARRDPRPMPRRRGPDPESLPSFELYAHDTTHNFIPHGHYDVRAKTFQGSMHDMHVGERTGILTPTFMPRIKVSGGTEELHV